MSDVSQEMINKAIAKAGRFVPAYTLNDATVYVFRVVDGCMRYARKSVITDIAIERMQVDSFILNVDADAGKLEMEFMSEINGDEYENTIIANVEYHPQENAYIPFDRFAIVDAYYWYFTHYHNGMHSPEYARLCKMQRYYKPSSLASMPSSVESATIYNQLQERNGYKPTGWMVLPDEDNCSDTILWNDAE